MNALWSDAMSDAPTPWTLGRWRRALPTLCAVAAAGLVATPMFGPAPVVPLLPLLCVIVWSLYQPRLMPPLAATIIGIATDLALAVPIGVNATLMPLCAILLRAGGARLAVRRFGIDWLMVGPLLIGYQLLAALIAGLIDTPRDPGLLVGQTLVSWALFPAIARAAAWAQARIGLD